MNVQTKYTWMKYTSTVVAPIKHFDQEGVLTE